MFVLEPEPYFGITAENSSVKQFHFHRPSSALSWTPLPAFSPSMGSSFVWLAGLSGELINLRRFPSMDFNLLPRELSFLAKKYT
jgi:hypothetical protein